MESLSMWICSLYIVDAVFQDERYAKYVGKQTIVPLTFGRHVPIISDKVGQTFCFCSQANCEHDFS